MRTPEQAIGEILGRIEPREEAEHVTLAQAFGRVLAADVAGDLDLPPFEKSAMDGYAVRASDPALAAAPGEIELAVVGESRAGAPWRGSVGSGECVAIYTGAELPAGCDAVVIVEKTRPLADGRRIATADRPGPGQHVCHRGEDLRAGEVVLARGRRITAIDLSVLAACGAEPALVRRRPRVAVLTTGDELVTADRRPGPGEIREGNTLFLAAGARRLGAVVLDVGIVRDDERELAETFSAALDRCDALITTGGVSMGRYDLVGTALERAGVEPVLHKVAIRPGKPIWFGMRGTTPVFGLPGNPVSCLVGFEVFVRPALAKLEGADPASWHAPRRVARWGGAATRENPREQYLPVRASQDEQGTESVTPLRWTSSADIVGLTRADGLAIVPADRIAAPGEPVRWFRL